MPTKMTPQQTINRITELEQWLLANPNHADRFQIETDLRKLTDEFSKINLQELPIERDTYNIYNV